MSIARRILVAGLWAGAVWLLSGCQTLLEVVEQLNLAFGPFGVPSESTPVSPAPPHSECKSSREIDFWCKKRIGLDDLSGGDSEAYFRNPVSVASLGGSRFAMANYRQIVCFDVEQRVTYVMSHDWGGRFNPNGLAYDATTRRLYVANFQGDDVLVFDAAGDALHTVEQIRTDAQPKSAALHEPYLAVACELGETVQLFDLSVTPAAMVWRTTVGPVHGVTIHDGFVYVTDLPNRRLVKLTLETGQAVAEVSGYGFDEEALAFIWPTSLAVHEGRLLLSDGLRGTLFLIDPETLERVDSFGKQGATDRFLLMPYGATSVDGQIVVASTGQDRIVFLTRDGGYVCAEMSVGARGDDWDYARETIAPHVKPIGEDWDWPAWRGGEPLALFDGLYDPGFRYLSRRGTTPTAPAAIYICHPETAFARDYLFTSVARLGEDFLFVSHASDVATYLGWRDGVPYYLPLKIPRRCWVVDDALYGPRGEVDLVGMKEAIDATVQSLAAARHANGWLSIGDYLAAAYGHGWTIRDVLEDRAAKFWGVAPPLDEATFRLLLARSFASSAGAAFWQAAQFFDESTPGETIAQAAADYFEASREDLARYMDEHFVVGMLCGTASNEPP